MNKRLEFGSHEQILAEMFRVLAHPARIQIVKILAQRKGHIQGEMIQVLPLSVSTVSQHLMELKKAGILSGQISGKKANYQLNWSNLELMDEYFRDFFDSIMSMNPHEG